MSKKTTAEVLIELTGDDRTEHEAATHNVWFNEPCDCDAHDDHDYGQEIRP